MFKVATYIKINGVKTFAEKCKESRAAGKDDVVDSCSANLQRQ